MSGSAALTVTAPTLVSIQLSPQNATIALGATQQFTATGVYTDGSTQDLTSTAIWSLSATAVAVINSSGLSGNGNGPSDHWFCKRLNHAECRSPGAGFDCCDSVDRDNRSWGQPAISSDGNVQRRHHAKCYFADQLVFRNAGCCYSYERRTCHGC